MRASTIIRLMRHTPGFIGVFPCDKIPAFKKGGVIVNTDTSGQEGEHWVSLYFTGDGRTFYFDPFGLPPVVPEIIIHIIKSSPRGCTFNSKPVQNFKSKQCGRFAILFLSCKLKGESFTKIISKLTHSEANTLKNLAKCTHTSGRK